MRFFFCLLFFLPACSGLEQSQQEKIKKQNVKGEFIYRKHDETLYEIAVPKHKIREKYSWEEHQVGNLPRINKEFFRCRGSGKNPPRTVEKQNLFDCNGRHSLPQRQQKEFIYPILLDLLNYVQAQTKKRVIVTSGYRCPLHNAYADPSPANQSSKHQIGAEVDFFVEGMEKRPEEIVRLLMSYYKGKKGEEEFKRYEKGDAHVSTQPWYNKEIFIKLHKSQEGRNLDNQHSYPYISIQVRFDRTLNEKVTYTYKEATSCYLRY